MPGIITTVSEVPDAYRKVELDDRERAMVVLLALHGDANTASKVLEDDFGVFLSPDGLRAVRNGEGKEFYDKLQAEHATRIEEALVKDNRELAARATSVEKALLDRLMEDLRLGKSVDAAKAVASVAKVKQTAIDKLLALTGRPQSITETRSAKELLKALEARRVIIPIEAAVEGTAEEQHG